MTLDLSEDQSPFHRGEQEVQERLGVRDIEHWARKVVRGHLPVQHRSFYNALPFLVIAARDQDGRPWVTLLDGPEEFIQSPDRHHLEIAAVPRAGDPLSGSLASGADIGILGIELSTRRRNRVNGRIVGITTDALAVRVDQAFGNCPQYIREREWHRVSDPITTNTHIATALSTSQQRWIRSADTFFIASGYRGEGESPTFGMDASHRGGERGFVEVVDDRTLRFPDYAGNNHFNTIGNLLFDPKAGLVFIDFASGSVLQTTGTTSIDWDSEELSRFPGAQRLVTFEISEIVERRGAVALRWSDEADSVRSLRLVEKTPESVDVTSFLFEARDGGPLPPFEPGQHLPLELAIPGHAERAKRTYSLSSSPLDSRYRITVKREPHGLVSPFLHDLVEPGAIVESRRPAGDFMMSCDVCPLVLVSAGVGVTPMMSILRTAICRTPDRPVWFVHGARDGRHHTLAAEVRAIAASHPSVRLHVAYSRPRAVDEIGSDYQSEGRVSAPLLRGLAASDSAHFFLCGPVGFMADIQTALEERGVPHDHIHTESFGPAAQDPVGSARRHTQLTRRAT